MANPAVQVKDGAGSFVGTTNGVDVTPGNTITIDLIDKSCESWTLSCLTTDETSDKEAVNGEIAVTYNATTRQATFLAPAAGKVYRFESVVDGGVSQGVRRASLRTTFCIYTLTGGGDRTIAFDETTEGNSEFGYLEQLNKLIRSPGGVASAGGSANQVQYNAGGGLAGAANTEIAGGDLCVGTNLGTVSAVGAMRTRDGFVFGSRSVSSGTDRGIIEHSHDGSGDWVSIGSYDDYAANKTVNETWMVAQNAIYGYVNDDTIFGAIKYAATVGGFFCALSQNNIALIGASGGITSLAGFGGGKGVLFLGNANVVPTTNPTGGLIAYVEGGDTLKLRRTSGAIVPVGAPAQAMAALDIDWSKGQVHTKTLAAGANAITFSNQASGMVANVRLTGAASTVTWPAGIKWSGGVAPTQTASGTDFYTFIHDGTSIYGSVVQNFS